MSEMDRLDQFAAAALTGILAGDNSGNVKTIAEYAYRLAQAMIDERGRIEQKKQDIKERAAAEVAAALDKKGIKNFWEE